MMLPVILVPIERRLDVSNHKQRGGYYEGGSVTLLRPDGNQYPGSPFIGGGLPGPWAATIDGNDNVWISNFATPGTRNTCIKDGLALRASVGVSIFWRAPVGPIRFDFSRVLAKEDYDKTETFRFSTSTRF